MDASIHQSVDSRPCAETTRGPGNTIVKKQQALPSRREATNKSVSSCSKFNAGHQKVPKCGAQRGVHGRSEGRGALELFSEHRCDTGRAGTGRTGHRKDRAEQRGRAWQERPIQRTAPWASSARSTRAPLTGVYPAFSLTHRARGGGDRCEDTLPILGAS